MAKENLKKAEPQGSAHLHLVILLLMSCSSAELMSSSDNMYKSIIIFKRKFGLSIEFGIRSIENQESRNLGMTG
jgi:hypothetical protein